MTRSGDFPVMCLMTVGAHLASFLEFAPQHGQVPFALNVAKHHLIIIVLVYLNQLKYIYENKTFETSKMLVNFHDKRSLHVISSRMKHQLHGDRNLYPPCDKGK